MIDFPKASLVSIPYTEHPIVLSVDYAIFKWQD